MCTPQGNFHDALSPTAKIPASRSYTMQVKPGGKVATSKALAIRGLTSQRLESQNVYMHRVTLVLISQKVGTIRH